VAGFSLRRGMVLLSVACVLVVTMAGCQGPTSVTLGNQPQGYQVSIETDPVTLNPPQLSTFSFRIVDTKTGKPVTTFAPVSDALLHNVLIHKDLQYFKHSYTERLVDERASLQTYFPRTGSYISYSLFQPVGAATQVFSTTVVTGEPTDPHKVTLEEDPGLIPSRVSGGMRVELVKPAGGYKVGRPSQIVFHVSERGTPVIGLWPLLGAPGHLWLVNDHAEDFAHVLGEAASRPLSPPSEDEGAEGSTGSTPTGGSSSTGGVAATGVPGSQMGTVRTPSPPPTLAPEVAQTLATITANPKPTLFPVQQTALSSILGTPEVRPQVGYGPEVVFTHTFPHAGLYKLWVEFYYRGEVFTTDFVIRAAK